MSEHLNKYLGLPAMDDEAEVTYTPPATQSLTATAISANIATTPPTQTSTEEQATDDYNYARSNIRDIIKGGTTVLENLLEVADSAQNPQMYASLATTMKTLLDANKELVALSKARAADERAESAPKGPSVQNNNLFVGSTQDLLDMLTKKKSNE